MTAPIRRLDVLDRAAIGYAAVYFACLTARAGGMTVPLVLDAAFYPLGLVVAWAYWRNSRAAGLDDRTRLAWRLLTASALVLWVSGTIWTAWITIVGRNDYGLWLNRLSFGQYLLSTAGYLAFPGKRVPRESRVRFALDVALIVVAALVLTYYVGFRLLMRNPAEAPALTTVEALLDWGMFVVAAVGCVQKRDAVIRRALVLLLSAHLASLAGSAVLEFTPAYRAGHPVDGLWFLAWFLRWSAARYVWYRGPTAGEVPSASAQPYEGSQFLYVMVGGVFALLFWRIVVGDDQFLAVLALAAIGMGGLLILRQVAELRENRRLFRLQEERESRFRLLVQESSDVVVVLDGNGVLTYVSPSLTQVFGPDARVERGMRLTDLLTPEGAARLGSIFAGPRLPAARLETHVQVAPGRWREVEAVWTDLRQDPAVNGIVVNCRDVTDRNEIERHLQRTQKLDAMGHLAGGLAHDLNNVLAIIRGYTELLVSDVPESSPARSDLDQVVNAVDRAAAVTKKVLAFSRKQSGGWVLLDLNAVVSGLEPMLRQLMKDQVEVHVDLEAGLWPVRADQGQIEQVLVNLATNGRDAMPDGGRLRIVTSNRTLEPATVVAGLRPGDYVAVVVTDAGIGMPAEILARIFEPFFTTKPKQRGIGLGLSIIQGIVSDADGGILVDSTVGKGTSVTVLLPRAEAATSG
jgi:PAS domain S-box-containing protein